MQMSKERLYFGNSRIASRKPGLQHELRVGLVLDQAAHAAHRLELRDPRHLRLDRRPALERQADDRAHHATVVLGEAVHPFRLVEILRHVDIDLDEHQALDVVGLRRMARSSGVQSRLSAGAPVAQA